MKQFTVIWRDNGDDFMVTTVELEDSVNPKMLSTNTWADMAHEVERAATATEDDEDDDYLPSRDGYDLISVIVGVPEYIY